MGIEPIIECECKSCLHTHRVEFRNGNSVDGIENFKRFLGPWMGKGLRVEDLSHLILAMADRALVGCVEVVPLHNSSVYLSRMKVARPFRGQKLAVKLTARALNESTKLSAVKAFAVTLHDAPAHIIKSFNGKEITKKEMIRYVPNYLIDIYGKKHKYWVINLKKNNI